MSSDPEALFVVGSPRSGTTLTAGLLSQLPGVWIAKETGFVPRLAEVAGATLVDWDDRRLAPVLDSVNSYLRVGRWEAEATMAGARRFWSETGTTGYAGLIRYVWSLEAPLDGARPVIVGDQTPNYVLALPFIEQLFPTARYVHVVRDPRDVVASIVPLPFGAQSAGVAASDWNECIAGWWAAERRIAPERRCEVRYEELVVDPSGTLGRLAAFLGMEAPDPSVAASQPNDVHGLAGLAPHHHKLGRPIDDRSVGRHLRDLSARDRDLVEAVTFSAMTTYGYATGPFRPSPTLEEDALLLTGERLRDLRRRATRRAARPWRR